MSFPTGYANAYKKWYNWFMTQSYSKNGSTQLDYFSYDLVGARYYDADIGLWTSVDPARQHWSGYTYGSNNPVNRVDPDGNMDIEAMFRHMFNYSGPNKVNTSEMRSNLADNITSASTATSFVGLGFSISTISAPNPITAGLATGAGVTSVGLSWLAFSIDPSSDRFSDAAVNSIFLGLGAGAGKALAKTEPILMKNGRSAFKNVNTGQFASTAQGLDDLSNSAALSTVSDATNVVQQEIFDD